MRGGDGDDLGHLFADAKLGEEGFFADAFALLAEFEVAPDEGADDGRVGEVKGIGIIADIGGAGDADAEGAAEFDEAGVAKVGGVFVPDDDVRGREAGLEEAMDDGGDDGGTGAGDGAGFGKDFDADDVVGADEAVPGGGDGVGAGEAFQAGIEDIGHAVVIGQVGMKEVLALGDEDARDGVGGVKGKGILRDRLAAEDDACQREYKLKPCVS